MNNDSNVLLIAAWASILFTKSQFIVFYDVLFVVKHFSGIRGNYCYVSVSGDWVVLFSGHWNVLFSSDWNKSFWGYCNTWVFGRLKCVVLRRWKSAIFGRLKYLIFVILKYFNFREIEICRAREIEMFHFRVNCVILGDWNMLFSTYYNNSILGRSKFVFSGD